MEGASGIYKKVAYKRPIKRISLEIQAPPPSHSDPDRMGSSPAIPDARNVPLLLYDELFNEASLITLP